MFVKMMMAVGTPGPGYPLLLRLGKDSCSYPKLCFEEQCSRTPAVGGRSSTPATERRSPLPAMGKGIPAPAMSTGGDGSAARVETSAQTASRHQADLRTTPSDQSLRGVSVPRARRSGTGKRSMSARSG